MKALGELLGGAKTARRARPMREPSLRAQTQHLSVFEVIAATKRAHDAMHMAEGTDDAPRRLLAWEREAAPDDADLTPYLAMVRKLAGLEARKAHAEKPKRAGLKYAGRDALGRSPLAQGDDHKPADPMWLQHVVLGHLQAYGRPVRATLPSGQMATRSAWRRAVAELVRKPPEAYSRLSGALMKALSVATRATTDVRLASNYCADPSWPAQVLGFANVRDKLHLPRGCACRGR